jgi:hypothetical protein
LMGGRTTREPAPDNQGALHDHRRLFCETVMWMFWLAIWPYMRRTGRVGLVSVIQS